MNKYNSIGSGSGNSVLLRYVMYIPLLLLFIGIIFFFTFRTTISLPTTTMETLIGTNYSIDNMGISTKVKRSGA
jgi:hypothetical protein